MGRLEIGGRVASVTLALLFACVACAATSHPPTEEPNVVVYHVPQRPEGVTGIPAGCRLIAESPPQSWSETDLASADTFRADRARAARLGANVLLFVEKLVRPRSDFDCASAQPISDCPKTLGAWYAVTVRSYDCDASARESLASDAMKSRFAVGPE
jgi:hypothetical protein